MGGTVVQHVVIFTKNAKQLIMHQFCRPIVMFCQHSIFLNFSFFMQEEIRCMKNEKFKNRVLKKIKILAKEYLISLRGPKSVKLKHVYSLKDYLKCERLTLEEKKVLFASKKR